MTRVAAAVLTLIVAAPGWVAASDPLPDVVIRLTVEVRDSAGWLVFHERVLGSPLPPARPLEITTSGGARGRRTITLDDPRFEAALVRPAGHYVVVVHGRITGNEARVTLGVFQQAILDRPSGPGETDLLMFYGLATVAARLLEFRVLPRP